MKVLGKNIVVELIKNKGTTPSSIILPDRTKKDPKFGTVRYVGQEVKELSVGDVIVLPQWSSNIIEIDGVECHICIEDNITVKL